MLTSYRIYRNMSKPEKTEAPVGIELLSFSNPFVWWVAELGEAVQECCPMLHDTPFPRWMRWLLNWKRKWGESEEPCTFADYYGDDLGCLWHCHVDMPLTTFVWDRIRDSRREVNVTLEEIGDHPEVGWIRADIAAEAQRLTDSTPETVCECGHTKFDHGSHGRCEHTDYPEDAPADRCYCEEFRPEHCYDWRQNPGNSMLFKLIEFLTRPLRTPR